METENVMFCAKGDLSGKFLTNGYEEIEMYKDIRDLAYSIAYDHYRSSWTLYQLKDGKIAPVTDKQIKDKFDDVLDTAFFSYETR